MYDVYEVAAYVINKSIELDKPITNLKLQKILYYIQAGFLVKSNEPCFDSRIEAWRHGPVVPEIYQEFRSYGAEEIIDKVFMRKELVFSTENDVFEFNEVKITLKFEFESNHTKIINDIVESYLYKGAWEIVNKTHVEAPWKDAYDGTDNVVIDNDAILVYYRNNEDKILN